MTGLGLLVVTEKYVVNGAMPDSILALCVMSV